MSIFSLRNFLMTLVTHDIRDISERPFHEGQHAVSLLKESRSWKNVKQ